MKEKNSGIWTHILYIKNIYNTHIYIKYIC